ncbi:MAG: cyclophilin-like fold protein [Blautia sp.]|nr:cyclophilin-like fold protein [Blautia sp.]
MKRYTAAILSLFLSLAVSACGNEAEKGENSGTVQDVEAFHTDSSPEKDTESELGTETEPESAGMEETEDDAVNANEIYIKIGEATLTAVLEENESAEALKELLADGSLTISASNYGGFEKVCSLGTELPRNDSQTTTHAGDICLYNGSQIVIFYGSNSWAYTRLGKISDADGAELEKVLGGKETEITLSLEAW